MTMIVLYFCYRIVEIERIEDPLLVLYVGGAGLVINLLGLVLFHGHSHGHHHHHDHDHVHNREYNDNEMLVDDNGQLDISYQLMNSAVVIVFISHNIGPKTERS